MRHYLARLALLRQSLRLIALMLYGSILLECMAQPSEVQESEYVSNSARYARMRRELWPEMIVVNGCTFQMGNPIADAASIDYRLCEAPKHDVNVQTFLIGRFLVTAEDFCQFLNDTGNHDFLLDREIYGVPVSPTIVVVDNQFEPHPKAERCPAYPITWKGASKYCEWLSKRLNMTFRLPTEAEWEFAARGPELRAWPWGNENPRKGQWAPSDEFMEFLEKNRDKNRELYVQTSEIMKILAKTAKPVPFHKLHGERWAGFFGDEKDSCIVSPVGTYARNATPSGIYDLCAYGTGEWCQDVFRDDAYGNSETGSPINEEQGGEMKPPRVLRGMSLVPLDNPQWGPPLAHAFIPALAKVYPTVEGRSWSRMGAHPTESGGIFRLAMDVDDGIPRQKEHGATQGQITETQRDSK